MSTTEALIKFPQAKKIAVENFTMNKEGKGMNMQEAMNLQYDARVYGWNEHTIRTIKAVIG